MPDSKPSKQPTPKVLKMSPTMESAKLALNNEFCFVERLPGIAVIPTLADPELHIYTRGDFINSVCSDRLVENRNVAASWMQWPSRRKVRNLTYVPGKPQVFDNQLNTWVPSAIVPVKGDLTLFHRYLDHIFHSDSAHRDWFLSWLAYQFQFPGVKLHSAVVFWSSETGTGKSLFGYIMAELFGHHNFSEINESELHGRFNFWAARKQFIMGEEIKGSNAQKQADFLKSVITRKFVTIDTKNTPHYTLPDCINYFFTSNRENAFSLDDTDRRFFVHQLSDRKLDADYVEHTLKPWLAQGGYAAILHHLLHEIDLTAPLASSGKPFNPFGAAPQTMARKAMIEAGREEIDIWMEEIAASPGEVLIGTPGWHLASAEDLYDQFSSTFPRARVGYKVFAGKLRKALPMVRGGNVVPLIPDTAPKRLYCAPSRFSGYEGASLASLKLSYDAGR